MKWAVLDVETTTKKKGSPFYRKNKLCAVGIRTSAGEEYIWDIEHGNEPYNKKLEEIKGIIESLDLLVGFNIKFDLHWIREYIPNVSIPRIHDCQSCHFIITLQQQPYPSLNQVSEYYNLGAKSSVVHLEYWAKGLDTVDVPWGELHSYLSRDLELTAKVFEAQRQDVLTNHKSKLNLIKLSNQDLPILMEMEKNGILYDYNSSKIISEEINLEVNKLNEELYKLCPFPEINWDSPTQKSIILYGGFLEVRTIDEEKTSPTRTRYKKRILVFKRRLVPYRKSESKRTKGIGELQLAQINLRRAEQGKPRIRRIFSVETPILRSLLSSKRCTSNKTRKILELIIKRSELQKLESTYYGGLRDLMDEMEWTLDGTIHGQYNQTVARTGRLSSSKPNMQNFAGGLKNLFITKYVD